MNDRAVDILKAYWLLAKGERKFPELEDISMSELENIWPSCFIAEAQNGKFVYTYFGEEMTDAYAENLEGQQIVDDLLYPETPELSHKMIEALNVDEPMVFDGALINRENVDIKFRKVLLPLGVGSKVTHLLGSMIWQKF